MITSEIAPEEHNVKIVVTVRENATGKEVELPDDETPWTLPVLDGQPCDFMWSEGNYACDCNRHLFFQRAANPGWTDEDEKAWGAQTDVCTHLLYSVRIVNAATGTVIYDEIGGQQ